MKNYSAGVGREPWIFNMPIDIFKYISLFAANNSFELRKESSEKSWTTLLKLFSKNLEKNVWVNWTATLVLFSKNFFHRIPPCIFAVIVNRLCTVFLKIIQNYINPNQGWWRWRGDFYPLSPPLLIPRNNSKMVKTVTLAFCSIIPNSSQSQDIWQNSDGDISDFRISGQSPVDETWYW